MRKRPIAGVAVVALAASASLVIGAGPAAADASTSLYVNNTPGSNCSNGGSGTQAQPYCTIAVAVDAVQPGQTINITGTYSEHVTITKSGTAGNPITLQHPAAGRAALSGADAGITIDGQHDVSIVNIAVIGVQNAPGIAVNNSSHIALQNIVVAAAATAPTPIVGIQLTGVTNSSIEHGGVTSGNVSTGVALDSATTGVLVKSLSVLAAKASGQTGIDVAGSNDTIIDSRVTGGSTGGIVMEPGAADNIIANNFVSYGDGVGILNTGASGTAITNNTLQNNCATGIRVDGASSGVSVQNNVTSDNGYRSAPPCSSSIVSPVEIGLYGAAVNGTVVDYNTVFHSSGLSSSLYARDTPMGLAAFRAASGQARYDFESSYSGDNTDSANSAAPGYQSTDYVGRFREDDRTVPDVGVGPITYADRGYTENVVPPTAQLTVTVTGPNKVTADASRSTPGGAPIASYTFDFGDGSTVTQSTPKATHQYKQGGTYGINVIVTDTNGVTGGTSQTPCVPGPVPSIPGASQLRADFNGDHRDDVALFYDYGGGHVALFTMAARACGGFDPPIRRTDLPYWGGGTRFVTTGDFNGDGKADIALFYDYGGGHVALFTLTADANGDGGFSRPVLRKDLPYWGSGTRFFNADDINGDLRSDIALFYDYGGGHVALFTMTADANGDGGFNGLLNQWNAPHWGGGTKFMTAGNYTADGRNDIALFYDYGGGHVALFILAAAPIGDGSYSAATLTWDDRTWGGATRFMFTGDFTGTGRDSFGLVRDSGGSVSLDTLAPDPWDGYQSPTNQWRAPYWGTGTRAAL